MKFGRELSERRVPAWAFYYLDYNIIKKSLVYTAPSLPELQEREQKFIEVLEHELQKINSFHVLKSSDFEHQLKSIKKSLIETKPSQQNGEFLERIEQKLESVASELQSYDEYRRLNEKAFSKLLKKHDKKVKNQLKAFWMLKLNKEPFIKDHPVVVDKTLLRLSKNWFKLNEMKNQEKKKSEKFESEKKEAPKQQNFERTTTKYWVPLEHAVWLKCEVLKHLPISSFNKRSDSLIASVYYDSENLVMYHERLRREEGSQIIRMRTYNEGPHESVFVERKVHHDTWTSEKSVKSRFQIKEKHLFDYVQGKYSVSEKIKKLKEEGRISDKEYEQVLSLSNDIQNSIVTKKLLPTLTSRYMRTAFQLENDATVRVSFDTSLDLIAEHGYENNRWGRDLSKVPDKEICHFPHAVLEIKLNLNMGEQAPTWVKKILEKSFVVHCGKFSKFIHGVAVLFPSKVTLNPPWFELLEATSDVKIKEEVVMLHPKSNSNNNEVRIDLKDEMEMKEFSNDGKSSEIKIRKDKPNNDGKKDPEDNKDKGPRRNWLERNIPILFNKEKKKNVQAPMRIEPKTFFANERTFIQWMSFMIIIQGIGFGLMSLGKKPKSALHTGGLIFVVVALIFMVYSLINYQIRRVKISRREKGPYDDRIGPIVVVVLLLIGLITTIALSYINYIDTCKGIKLIDNSWYVYNPSELIWHAKKNRLVMVGPNMVSYIDPAKYTSEDHLVVGDLEGLCQVPFKEGYLYLGLEYPPTILEMNEENDQIERRIPLTIPNIINPDVGMEGLTFVPDDSHPEGGLFWAASQADGYIYTFEVPLKTQPNSTVAYSGTNWQPAPGLNSLQALYYDSQLKKVFAIASRWLLEIDSVTRETLKKYALGVSNPEGIAIVGDTAYLGCDACNEVWSFVWNIVSGFESGRCTSAQATV